MKHKREKTGQNFTQLLAFLPTQLNILHWRPSTKCHEAADNRLRGESLGSGGAFRGKQPASLLANSLEPPLPNMYTILPIRPSLIFTSIKSKQQVFLALIMQNHQSKWIYVPSHLFGSYVDRARDTDSKFIKSRSSPRTMVWPDIHCWQRSGWLLTRNALHTCIAQACRPRHVCTHGHACRLHCAGGKHSESEMAPESMGNALIGIHRQVAIRSAWNY